jgi:phosphotriesterase-related protein
MGTAAMVNAVTGPVETDRLGFTLMHEHIVVSNWAMRQSYPGWLNREIVIKQGVDALSAARASGVSTIVDATPVNLGRDIHLIAEVAARTGMQIIAATGLYWNEEPWLVNWDPDRLVDWLLRDITDGIQGTDIKAGIIKCATDKPGLTAVNRKLLQAAARLHRASGVPITTHTNAACRVGLLQQDVFEEEGVDLSRVVIGHCGDSSDIEYLQTVLGRGSFIGMDRFSQSQFCSTAIRVQTVAELCRRGWADRMVLSHDRDVYLDWSPEALDEHRRGARPLPFCHVANDILPLFREAGVTEEQIRLMTVENPRRIFEKQ